MRRAKYPAIVALILLAACGTLGNWQKPGADAEAAARDRRECRAQADQVLARARAINEDIAATRGPDWERTGTVELQHQQMEAHAGAAAAQVFAACMQAKGYTEKSPP